MPQATILYLGPKNDYLGELQKILESKKIQIKQIDSLQIATDYLANTLPHLLLALTPEKGVTGLTLCQEWADKVSVNLRLQQEVTQTLAE